MNGHMFMYNELASLWHLISPPSFYADDALRIIRVVRENVPGPERNVLILGGGGGSLTVWLKEVFDITIVDKSRAMLDVSRDINPECEHVRGDMRRLRLRSRYDAVVLPDAVSHMSSPRDVRAALRTAHHHCRVGGVAIVMPETFSDTFHPQEQVRRFFRGNCGLYLRRVTMPDEKDPHRYEGDYRIRIRVGDDVQHCHEVHTYGLYSQDEWVALMKDTGFLRVKRLVDRTAEGECLPVGVVGWKGFDLPDQEKERKRRG